MTLKHFINEVVQLLQEHLGEHYIVETATTLKNNSVELSGVQIRHEKDNIFPTIYLNDFYELYEKNSGGNCRQSCRRISGKPEIH